jgi:hypothetical protein
MAQFFFKTVLPTVTISGNTELSLPIVGTTYVPLAAVASFNIFGVFATGGNVDGMIVCLQRIDGLAFTFSFLSESSSASSPSNRFRNPASATYTPANGYGGATYRYTTTGGLNRWIMIGKTT